MTMYYAFKGKRPIAGPFRTRKQAKEHGKAGLLCRYCGEYSGGNTICYACILLMFSGPTELKASAGKDLR